MIVLIAYITAFAAFFRMSPVVFALGFVVMPVLLGTQSRWRAYMRSHSIIVLSTIVSSIGWVDDVTWRCVNVADCVNSHSWLLIPASVVAGLGLILSSRSCLKTETKTARMEVVGAELSLLFSCCSLFGLVVAETGGSELAEPAIESMVAVQLYAFSSLMSMIMWCVSLLLGGLRVAAAKRRWMRLR